VVFVRGVLPAVLATAIACSAWRRSRGSDPGAPATLVVGLCMASLVTLLLLAAPFVPGPRLEVKSAIDGIATVLLLGAASSAADLLARRLPGGRAG
jgi:drug/metabolite transporter (DMT)-like permease